MSPIFRRRRIPSDLMDRLRMAAAVASEQVLEEHVRSATEMVEEGVETVPIERVLAHYARLHHLPEREAGKVRERVLAALGRSGRGSGPLEDPRSLVTRMLRRLRGRVDLEFRTWVDRHTARVQLTLMDIHVENALDMVREVGERLSVAEVLSLYGELMGLRSTVYEIVGLRVLRTLHNQDNPHVEPLRRDHPLPLRVAENDG